MTFIFDDVLTDAERIFVQNNILSENPPTFPWFYIGSTVDYHDPEHDHEYFIHTLVHRIENSSDESIESRINSRFFSFFNKIFFRVCEKADIYPKKIFRAAVNLTLHQPVDHGGIHLDHFFEHKNFLLYLNDFTGGSTYVYNENHEVIEEIQAKKNRAVIFDGKYHAASFCAPKEKRVVAVFTFL